MTVRESDHTEEKQAEVQRIARIWGKAWSGILRDWPNWARPEVLIIDCHAGDGRSAGSPAIFIRILRELGVPFRMILFERDPRMASRLRHAMKGEADKISVFLGSCEERMRDALELLPPLARGVQFGLIYVDPNNGRIPVLAIDAVLRRPGYDRMDILVHVAARSGKRTRGAGLLRSRLNADIKSFRKKWIFAKEFDQSNHDWAMILTTNWPKPARIASYENIKTARGQVLWERLTLTVAEREARHQPSLFPPVRTAPTSSTSAIPDSSPSVPSSSSGPAAAASAAD